MTDSPAFDIMSVRAGDIVGTSLLRYEVTQQFSPGICVAKGILVEANHFLNGWQPVLTPGPAEELFKSGNWQRYAT